jgi:hypothetical protein
MSWDELEAIGQAKDIRDVDQHRKDTDRLYLKVFGTEDGAKLMKYMRDTILEQPVAVPGSPADYAFYREGQNSIIREIEARIYRARNP